MAMGPNMRWVSLAMLACMGSAGLARAGKVLPPEIEEIRQMHPELSQPGSAPQGRSAQPAAIPDIYGPGSVLNVGNVVMKVTNNGFLGNPFFNISSDPSGQWPGTSAVEYLFFIAPAVAAVNPNATDPNAVRRVSYAGEWWPPSGDPEDRIYRSYDGAVNGARFVNDDGDRDPVTLQPRIDEDFLDGRDNDGDGKVDEDYAALGQQMFSCVMRDDTPAALSLVGIEQHIPLGLELRQLTWAYSVKPFTDFDAIEWTIFNRSGHTLDSMYIGFRCDMDCGPIQRSNYYNDDIDVPFAPSGEFKVGVDAGDPKFQLSVSRSGGLDTLCPSVNVRVNGWSVADNDGDQGATPGVPSLLLIGHTVDPLGVKAPRRVGFRAFRSFIGGTPYTSNGNPTIDQQRTEFMRSDQNIDPATGFIDAAQGDQEGDYSAWAASGPFLKVPNGGSIQATIAFAVQRGDRTTLDGYQRDYALYKAGRLGLDQLFERYPIVENAFTAQVAFEGKYEVPPAGFEDQVPNCHGCESAEKLPLGSTPVYKAEDCPGREPEQKQVTDTEFTWFDFDCDPCTGVWDEFKNQGYFLRHWVAESPPPAPNLNVSATYNYTDNPDRVVASGDGRITLAWDNLSEVTADPKTGLFDFRSYKVWKVANWRRPVGSSGPNDDDWTLMGDFRYFDYADSNKHFNPDSGRATCPQVLIPNLSVKDVVLLKSTFATRAAADAWVEAHGYRIDGASEEADRWRYRQEVNPCRPESFHTVDLDVGVTGEICGVVGPVRSGVKVPICLYRHDLWDPQSGTVIRPDPAVACVLDRGECVKKPGVDVFTGPGLRTQYKVGRYRLTDYEVKNGFLYFYSVTAGDSSVGGELSGRRSAVEADGVTPQASTVTNKGVWVVPNPYRGFRNISARSSSWDLTPNASDPTGTHVDFMGLPGGAWTIKIFTVAGDLVAELHDSDPVNDSVRGPVTDANGFAHPGYNKQQDYAGDGQARWNLISRNGQDVVSGIYLFVVDSAAGSQRGKFVIIR